MIIDTQVHMWPRPGYLEAWQTLDGKPRFQPAMPPDPTLALMDGAGVHGAVIVPPIWAGDDNAPYLRWCGEHPGRLGVMGRFDLWSQGPQTLATWLAQPGMLGIRLSFRPRQGKGWLDPDEFPWFWQQAEQHQIPLMLLIQGTNVGRLGGIAERHPDLCLIVDHLGLLVGDPATIDPARHLGELLALARFPSVYAKVSGMPCYTRDGYPYPSLQAPIRAVYDAFGPARMMWGSDFTRTRNSAYGEVLDHVRVALPFLSGADRAQVLGRTAAEVLRWPERICHRFACPVHDDGGLLA